MPDETTALEHNLFTQENPANDFLEYWVVIVGNLPIVLAITAIFALTSIVYFSMQPNVYTAHVQILVEKTQPTPRSAQEMFIPSFRGEDDYYGTQIAIMTGRKIADKVAAEVDFRPPYQIQAKRLRESRIIILSVTYRDPLLAAKIANKFAEVFVGDSVNENLFVNQQMLKLIPQANELGQENAPIQMIGEFNKQEYAESFASVMNDLVIQKMKVEKLDIEAKLSEYSQRYKPEHPLMKELNERLNYVDGEIKGRTDKIIANMRAGLAGEVKISNVKILEAATTPGQPSGPKRARGITVSTVVGFLTGSWLVIVTKMLSGKIHTERDLDFGFKIPFLGYVPVARELMKYYRRDGTESFFKPISLVTAIAKNHVLADAVASVRTHILFSMPYEKSKRIMLTSAVPEEGKSTVAALLALSLVTLGRKILLIDADMRRPSLHKYLNMKNEKGLSDFLVGLASFEEVVKPVAGSELKIITSGGKSDNPAELLASERFRELLDKASERFDRVVLDVPPVLFIADGLIVAKNIHSGILVCGSGMVQKKVVQRVVEKFTSVGYAFIGIVINHADYEKEGYRYRYYKNYKSYYTKKT